MAKIVLVVDDDRDGREALAEVLSGMGYTVVQARDGLEALAQVRASAPDLILLDLAMPNMNGWEFRRVQLADDAIAHVPVVVVSATVARLEVLRPSACLAKPFDVHRLLETVELLAA